MRPSSLLLAAIFALCSHAAFAQSSAPTADPREMSDVARKAYAKGLKDARTLLSEKKYAEALFILDGLTTDRPREPQARFLTGVALADSGKADEAVALYLKLLADFPELPEVRNNLAVLYAQKGNYEGARDELIAALQAAPDYVIAYENLGDVYARLAGVNYEKAIARDAKNKTAPPKLKLVRDVLGMRTPPPPAATAAAVSKPASTSPATTAAESPPAAANAAKPPESAEKSVVPDAANSAPAAATDTPK
jgi:tetratricopeptide (TPR) repeat protein